jgi:hypothetical protein
MVCVHQEVDEGGKSMHKTYSFRGVITASVLASVLSVAALWFVYTVVISPDPAFAQRSGSPDVVLYAAPRGVDGSDESFIFYNTKTGDIWVYRDRKLRDRYRLTELGEDLEKVQ